MTRSGLVYNTFYESISIRGWYRDSQWAGRSGDRIPVRERFSVPVQTGPEVHSASCTIGKGALPRQ